ncbi:MAG: CBS domain-containing protein [Rhodoferax sp.]|nr:CBS domain-containing protein [Rhodoferax sp.]MDP3654731.1 CBS domain-containing protein [Rhodoferax sp.]
MFSVYGKAGRLFRGSMEELRTIGPASALAGSRNIRPLGRDAQDHAPSHFADLLQSIPSDAAHRNALAAYAQTTKIEMPRHPLTRVDAIMSHAVVTLADSFTVEQAWRVLAQQGIGQAPVVGADGVLVGLLSRGDLMREDRLPTPDSHPLVWRALLAQSVVDLMWTPVPSVATDTDIRRVARVLLDTGLSGLPVADDHGQVIGFVARSDILRAVVADPPLDLWT